MKVVAFIFARGGSKGLPGKNLRPLGGKPLIAWSIEHALAVERIGRVIVSTDSEEIASVARAHGAEVPFLRPADLARDDSPEWLAWRHALGYLLETNGALPQAMVSLPATAPLRLPSDIERCLDLFDEGTSDVIITVTDSHRSPYFNMVKLEPNDTVSLIIPPLSVVTRRQDAPIVYDMTTAVYVIRPEFVMTNNYIFEGRVRSVYLPLERAIDIDTLLDFRIAEYIFSLSDKSYEIR